MTDKNQPDNTDHPPHPSKVAQRRAALKKLLGASSVLGVSAALPERWAKPVVDAVVIPSHAQSSPDTDDDTPQTRQYFDTVFSGAMAGNLLLDTLVPPAYAQQQPLLCIFATGNSFTARLSDSAGDIFTGGGTVGGGAATLLPAPNCMTKGDHQLIVFDAGSNSATISLDGSSQQSIQRANCGIPSDCPEE